jgi:hypothetical protein
MREIVRENAWARALKPKTHFYGFLPAVLCLAMVWPFGSGWHTVNMMAGSATPGARGTVKFKIGDNGNTELDIETHALAAPSSLEPPANHYVVWIEPPGKPAHDLGALSVGQHENGELKTVTPYKRFRIFISAEQNSQESMPSGPTVLSATVTEGS